jgi:hypothetical protein
VAVPLAWKLLMRVAESDTEPPTVMVVADSVLDRVGLALLTVRGSQGLVAALLTESPLYVSLKLKGPKLLNATDAESGTIAFVTVTVETTVRVPVQPIVSQNA